MEFKAFPSIPRLSKEMVITEKIDWTNACIVITDELEVLVQSRNRLIRVGDDNYWFAYWVENNKQELLQLWPWYHYGEWWGSWINRWYWKEKWEKIFSLFYYRGEWIIPEIVKQVPILYTWNFDTNKIEEVLNELKEKWSVVSPWYMNVEWIVIYHTASKQVYKKTIEWDEWKFTLKN